MIKKLMMIFKKELKMFRHILINTNNNLTLIWMIKSLKICINQRIIKIKIKINQIWKTTYFTDLSLMNMNNNNNLIKIDQIKNIK